MKNYKIYDDRDLGYVSVANENENIQISVIGNKGFEDLWAFIYNNHKYQSTNISYLINKAKNLINKNS